MSFEHRGVVEGFYGEAWSQADRLWMLDRMGAWGMNRYLYAPKDDPLHRELWRDAYHEDAMREFGRLIERGLQVGVDVGFALSPGLSIHYSSADDVAALARKFRGFAERGARFFGLTLDDIPSELAHADDRQAFTSLASAHVQLAHALRDALGPDCLLWLVPTDYMGVHDSPYLEEVGERLDPAIEVGWTGRNVLPATIRASEALTRASVLRRKILVWDNTPVADGPMRNMLHLGPYCGRDAELDRHCSGLLLNPMQLARASAPTLRTGADYLNDPARYDAEVAWRAAVEEAGQGAPDAFATFALAHRFSPLACDDRDRALEAAVDTLRMALERAAEEPATRAALTSLRKLLAVRQPAASRVRDELTDRSLMSEIEAWLLSHERECARMMAALDCLDVLCGSDSPNAKGLAVGRMQGRLTRLPVPQATSFGPRRAFYPVFESLEEANTRFASEPGLFIDCCLADDLIELAEATAVRQLGLVRRKGTSA